MKIRPSEDFIIVLMSSVILSSLAFALVSLWQFGKVSAQGNEVGITLIPAEFSASAQRSPFANLNRPRFYKPVSLSIEKAGLFGVAMADITIDPQNRLGVPESYDAVGWFKDGPKPGEPGNAVIDGHYDKRDGSPAVFYRLGKLTSGDIINIVDERGRQLDFEVYDVGYVNVSDPVSSEKAFEDSDRSVITLITCGGVWNAREQNYSKRLLVKAKLI